MCKCGFDRTNKGVQYGVCTFCATLCELICHVQGVQLDTESCPRCLINNHHNEELGLFMLCRLANVIMGN